MNPRALLFSAGFGAGLLACGGAVESPSPTGTAPSASGVTAPSPSVPTVTPAPTSTTVPSACTNEPWSDAAFGCGNFQIVVAARTHEALLVVSGDRSALGLQRVGDSTPVDLSGNGQRIGVRVEHYGTPLVDVPYCSGTPITQPKPPIVSNAVSGRITFALSGLGREGGYALTMTLQGLMVRRADGALECIPDATFDDIAMGSLPG